MPVGGDGAMQSLVIKRSIVIGGHKTSVSLEEAFWKSLREIAHERHQTLSHLVSGIDASRQAANLSSAIRVFILEFYKGRSAQQGQAFQQREIPIQ
jgi:predicted DNA-binding ribbon-helix-helix protein